MSGTTKLSITLTNKQSEMVRALVESGRFASTSEVIRDALRAWERDEEAHKANIARIKAKIQKSLDDPRPTIPIDEVFDRQEARIREKAGQKLAS